MLGSLFDQLPLNCDVAIELIDRSHVHPSKVKDVNARGGVPAGAVDNSVLFG
jgi:hypothetical protein